MSNIFTHDKRTHFMPDSPRGSSGGGEDPFDHDDQLAHIFKRALSHKITYNIDTPSACDLPDHVSNIMQRIDQVGRCLILVSPDLRPIAKTLLEIKSPSDRLNPAVLEHKFKDFDLSV